MVELLLIRAEIFTPEGSAPLKGKQQSAIVHIKNGAVAVENGKIREIGSTDELLKKYRDAQKIVDLNGKALLPGFVDPHTHALFVGTREQEFKMRLEGKSYMEILQAGGGILNTLKKVRSASISELKEALIERANLFLEYGTTTIEVKSGYGLDFENEIKMLRSIKEASKETPLEMVATFVGAHAIPPEFKNDKKAYIKLITQEMIPYIAAEGLAEFIDVFCERGVYTAEETKEVLIAGIEHGLKARIHADEIASIGCSELAGELSIRSCDHLLKIEQSGIEAMKRGSTAAVLLPVTAFSLKENYAPARKLIDAGIPVAIATDCNPGSSYSESMPITLALSVMQMGMKPEEALVASTINAAWVLDRASYLGSIEEGKQADFVVLKEPDYLFIPYHFGINPVYATYKRGKRVFAADC